MKTNLTTMALTTWVKSIDNHNIESRALRDVSYKLKKLKVNQLEKMRDKKDKKDLIYRCDNWGIARNQRDNELKNNLGLKGTMGYQNIGCYECLGVKQDCVGYSNILKIKIIDENGM